MLMPKLATNAFTFAYAPDKPLQDRLMGAYDLLRFGFIDNARNALSDINQRQPTSRGQVLAKICERAEIYNRFSRRPADGVQSISFEGLSEPIRVRPPKDVMVIRTPDAKQLLVSFGGASSAFWLPPPILNLPGTHVIALRDDRSLWHLGGIKGLGSTYEQAVVGMKRLIGELQPEKVVLVGCSSGGYAALRYALDLGVRSVLAISPMTGHEDIPSLVPKFPALRPLVTMVPGMPIDLRPLYQSHPNPPNVIIAWGEQHEIDSEQARRMKDLPTFTLMPLPNVATHAAWLKLLSGKELEPMLHRAFAF